MLSQLEQHDPMLAKAILLRWIGGLSSPAIAEVLARSVRLVEGGLQFARQLLRSRATSSGG